MGLVNFGPHFLEWCALRTKHGLTLLYSDCGQRHPHACIDKDAYPLRAMKPYSTARGGAVHMAELSAFAIYGRFKCGSIESLH